MITKKRTLRIETFVAKEQNQTSGKQKKETISVANSSKKGKDSNRKSNTKSIPVEHLSNLNGYGGQSGDPLKRTSCILQKFEKDEHKAVHGIYNQIARQSDKRVNICDAFETSSKDLKKDVSKPIKEVSDGPPGH